MNQKLIRLLRAKSNSGIILIVVLWILVILTMLAVSLGRRASVELALTKHMIGQLKSKYIAMAGIVHVIDLIKRDSNDEETGKFDTKYQCGISLEDDQMPDDLFQDVEVGEGKFQVSYLLENISGGQIRYGLEDEESKINLNAITPDNYKIFKHLLLQFNIEDEDTDIIASSVVDWRDATGEVFNEPYGAEDDYYNTLENAYHCKNNAFESLEELMLVRGMTAEIFARIKDYITVYPMSGKFLVNIDTASSFVLRSMAHSLTGAQSNTTIEDADSLVEKLLEFRAGDDGAFASKDDPVVDVNQIPLNAKEKILFLLMARNQTKVSKYLRVHVKGIDEHSRVSSDIEAVVYRENLSLVYWRRD